MLTPASPRTRSPAFNVLEVALTAFLSALLITKWAGATIWRFVKTNARVGFVFLKIVCSRRKTEARKTEVEGGSPTVARTV